MAETLNWGEGQVYIFTGTASAIVAYAQDLNATMVYGWDNRQLVAGTYLDIMTGQRVDLSIRQLYAPDATLQRLAASTAQVNVHLKHSASGGGGSAGIYLYSGRIDQINLAGSENNPYVFGLNYHANLWSAYP